MKEILENSNTDTLSLAIKNQGAKSVYITSLEQGRGKGKEAKIILSDLLLEPGNAPQKPILILDSADNTTIHIQNYGEYLTNIAMFGSLQYTIDNGIAWLDYDNLTGITGKETTEYTIYLRYVGNSSFSESMLSEKSTVLTGKVPEELTVPVTGVRLGASGISLEVGEIIALTSHIEPSTASNQKIFGRVTIPLLLPLMPRVLFKRFLKEKRSFRL